MGGARGGTGGGSGRGVLIESNGQFWQNGFVDLQNGDFNLVSFQFIKFSFFQFIIFLIFQLYIFIFSNKFSLFQKKNSLNFEVNTRL